MKNTIVKNASLAMIVGCGLALSACSVEQTEEGNMPKVEVTEEGRMPAYDVETADVHVGTRDTTVTVPEVDVSSRETTISVPDVEVTMPSEKREN